MMLDVRQETFIVTSPGMIGRVIFFDIGDIKQVYVSSPPLRAAVRAQQGRRENRTFRADAGPWRLAVQDPFWALPQAAPCNAPWKSNAAWSRETPTFRWSNGSNS